MVCFLKLFYVTVFFASVNFGAKINLTLTAITTIGNEGISGWQVVGGQNIAIDRLNSMSDILGDYHINLEVLDVAGDPPKALPLALDATGNGIECLQHSNTSIQIPFVLGAPWSSISTYSNPALAAFNWGQISSGATSVALSDKDQYPTFYRTIPNDAIQAEAIAELCNEMGWNDIGIIYVNDNYGIYLAVGLMAACDERGIKTTSIGYTDTDEGITNAAKQLKAANKFVTVLVVHSGEIEEWMLALIEQEIHGYPYYYIGVDAWIDEAVIVTQGIQNLTEGFIGTLPWAPGFLGFEHYSGDEQMEYLYNETTSLGNEFDSIWEARTTGTIAEKVSVYNLTVPGSTSYYGYESLWLLALALDKFDKLYNLTKYQSGNITNSEFSSLMRDIITNGELWYFGLTGNVTLDRNGDRTQGLYGFANADQNGKTDFVGYYFSGWGGNGDSYAPQPIISINTSNIYWPSYFGNNLPKTKASTVHRSLHISKASFISMTVLSILSILLASGYIYTTYTYRKSKILQAASWRLNIIMCWGCILAYIAAILWGLDESFYNKGSKSLDFLCNIRMWLLIIGISLGYSPLFMKTYRIARIFSDARNLSKRIIKDKELIKILYIILGVDIILLTILTFVDPHVRKYQHALLDKSDPLNYIQFEYGQCFAPSRDVNFSYYIILGLWKCLELIWGIYFVSVVCRIGIKQITAFDETAPILVAIVFSVLFTITLAPIIFLLPFHDKNDLNNRYIIFSFSVILVFNVLLASNVGPRLWAIYAGKEHKYKDTPEEKIKKQVIKYLKQIGVTPQVINEFRSKQELTKTQNSNNVTANNTRKNTIEFAHLSASPGESTDKIVESTKTNSNGKKRLSSDNIDLTIPVIVPGITERSLDIPTIIPLKSNVSSNSIQGNNSNKSTPIPKNESAYISLSNNSSNNSNITNLTIKEEEN